MMPVMTIALASFREAIRAKILYTFLLFALIMMAFSRVLESTVMAERAKMVKDIGLGAISLIGIFIAITVGANVFFKELKRLSSYSLFSKPVSKGQILLGKYVGAVFAIGVTIVFMGSILLLNTAAVTRKVDPHLLVGVGSIFMELAVIAAFALFFAVFGSPVLSGILTGGVYVLGHMVAFFRPVLEAFFPGYPPLLNIVFLCVPDLERFNLKANAVYHDLPSGQHLVILLAYGVTYIVAALFAAWLLLRKKDIK
jgi:ABC-type transport system involved in multi-copper enzyme maturation permease subunit